MTAGITTFYMFRMWFLTFTGKPRDHHVYEHAHESPWMMTVPLIVLAVFSVVRRLGLAARGTPRRAALEHHDPPRAAGVGAWPTSAAWRTSTSMPERRASREQSTNALRATSYHDLAGMLALVVVAIGIVVRLR